MKLISLVRNDHTLKHSLPPNTMIVLVVIAIWIFLALLTVTVCVSARRGDLSQDPASTEHTDRSRRLSLPGDRELPLADDKQRAAA